MEISNESKVRLLPVSSAPIPYYPRTEDDPKSDTCVSLVTFLKDQQLRLRFCGSCIVSASSE